MKVCIRQCERPTWHFNTTQLLLLLSAPVLFMLQEVEHSECEITACGVYKG